MLTRNAISLKSYVRSFLFFFFLLFLYRSVIQHVSGNDLDRDKQSLTCRVICKIGTYQAEEMFYQVGALEYKFRMSITRSKLFFILENGHV